MYLSPYLRGEFWKRKKLPFKGFKCRKNLYHKVWEMQRGRNIFGG